MDRGTGGPGSSLRSRVLITVAVVAIVAAAGAILFFARSRGGENPAPQLAATQTVTKTVTVSAGANTTASVPDQGHQRSDVPQVSDIHSVDWATMLGVAPDANSPDAQQKGFLQSVDYHDFTGSGHNDQAVVQVRQVGSDATLDYYVFTVRNGDLKALLQRTGISHGQVKLGPDDASLVETSPVYAAGDPNCCPSNLRNITWTWDSGSGSFIKSHTEIVPGPGAGQ